MNIIPNWNIDEQFLAEQDLYEARRKETKEQAKKKLKKSPTKSKKPSKSKC